MGLMILDGGDDPTKVVKADFDKAIDRLQEGVDSGQIRQFTGNDYSARSRRATSGRRSRGRATWCS